MNRDMMNDSDIGVDTMEIKQLLTKIDSQKATLASYRPLTQCETERLRDEWQPVWKNICGYLKLLTAISKVRS